VAAVTDWGRRHSLKPPLIVPVRAVAWLREDLRFLAIRFGAQLVMAAIFSFIQQATTADEGSWAPALLVVLSVPSFIPDIQPLAHPLHTSG
jgi:hypothetical protein